MDIKQLKQDRANGVMLCRVTIDKLIDAALDMEDALTAIEPRMPDSIMSGVAGQALRRVKEL